MTQEAKPRWPSRAYCALRVLLTTVGLATLLGAALCFTPWPWRAYRTMSEDALVLDRPPDVIVVLGGGGIPSESGLVRAYHGAVVARAHPGARVILALPADGPLQESGLGKMREELVLHGVSKDRILLEDAGRNTREQAMNVRRMLGAEMDDLRILLITSPDHMRRALLCFRKLGLAHVAASAAFAEAVKADLTYSADELGGGPLPLPDWGTSMTLRYRVWSNAGYLAGVGREIVALLYYKARGWI